MNIFDLALDTKDKEWFERLCKLNNTVEVSYRDFSKLKDVFERVYENNKISKEEI